MGKGKKTVVCQIVVPEKQTPFKDLILTEHNWSLGLRIVKNNLPVVAHNWTYDHMQHLSLNKTKAVGLVHCSPLLHLKARYGQNQ